MKEQDEQVVGLRRKVRIEIARSEIEALDADVDADVDADRLWRAVLERETSFDGTFVYAVFSTKIYCRPSCPSKRPRIDQVRFFASPNEAREAGYRACLRCKPDEVDVDVALVERVLTLLETMFEAGERPTSEALAVRLGVGVGRLRRSCVQVLGLSLREYVRARQLERLKVELREGADVSRAMFEAGCGSSSAGYLLADELGMSPAAYRRGGAQEQVSFTIAPFSLGQILVARTERGICAVQLGENATVLETELRREYPAAVLEADDQELKQTVQAVLEAIEGGVQSRPTNLSVDVRATAFQRRVFEALRRIPCGETWSYSRLAREIGAPRSTRAVARACASNPIAVLVPCHRVVREDGGLGGYRWGLERKRTLLEREAIASREHDRPIGAPATDD